MIEHGRARGPITVPGRLSAARWPLVYDGNDLSLKRWSCHKKGTFSGGPLPVEFIQELEIKMPGLGIKTLWGRMLLNCKKIAVQI